MNIQGVVFDIGQTLVYGGLKAKRPDLLIFGNNTIPHFCSRL